jgi:hypothetical protein
MAVDTRLEDFLQDKLQTSADLETLDSLLDRVRSQQALLRAQLQEAEEEARQADETSKQFIRQIDHQSSAFQHEQADIDRRLLIITQSEASEDAVRRFEASLAKLRRLELASGYLGLLAEVDTLCQDATEKLKSSPDNALDSYNTLRKLQLSLKPLQAEAEGAAPHLLDHIERVTINLRAVIRNALAKELDALLQKIFWPKPAVALPHSFQQQWDVAVTRLLSLQHPELEMAKDHDSELEVQPPPPVLLPLEVMVAPLEARFRYHFTTDRPTNRLDKPEYFLSHVLDLLASHDEFVNDNLQPLLLTQFRGTAMVKNPIYIDATSAFITSLLPMLRAKLLSIISQAASQPQLLSHLVHELIDFDTTLRNEWHYTGNATSPSHPWKGMTWEILMTNDYFSRWLQVEKDFALARYQSIIDNSSTSALDYDSTPPGTTKPSLAAIQVHDLLETITDRYRPLYSFTNKIRFLIEIQISIFDRFHNRLHSGLEAYLSITTGLGRAVQGASSADLAAVQGTNGLDRLCRIFGSADYLEKKMRDWSDDIFFLDLWNELQSRARHNKRGQNSRMNVAEVVAKTSHTLQDSDSDDTGALFDETAGAYAKSRAKAESTIVDTLTKHVRDALRPYSRSNVWSSLSSASTSTSDDDSTLPPSIDLTPAISYLTESLTFLAGALGPLPLRRINKQILRTLDTYLLDRVILAHSFSLSGANQVRADVHAIVDVFERVDEGVAQRGLRRCIEASYLLVLPVKRSTHITGGDEDAADAWDVASDHGEEKENAMETEGPDPEESSSFNLWDVEHRLFESNDSARVVLDEMAIQLLTESEARQVLQRRVELGT